MKSVGEKRRERMAREEEKPRRTIDVYEVLVECRDEEEQRELFERLRREGRKVRLLVL